MKSNHIDANNLTAAEKAAVRMFTQKIEDITGRQILQTMEFTDAALTENIDISSLRNGLYFVVVTDENNNYIQRTKFVKLK
jgi:FAD synthase